MSTTKYPPGGVSDPEVPVDGTKNITGNISASGAVISTVGTNGSAFVATTGSSPRVILGSSSAASVPEIRGSAIDAATTVALRLAAVNDLTTSGAKILSIGDNAGSSYSEKAYIDLNGVGAFGTSRVNLGGSKAEVGGTKTNCGIERGGSGELILYSNVGNTAATLTINTAVFIAGLAVSGVTAVKTTTYTATSANFLVPCSTTGGAWTLTLPAANAAKGQNLWIKLTATSANLLTIQRAGTDTITTMAAAGATSFTLNPASTLPACHLVSDGTSAWYVIALNV